MPWLYRIVWSLAIIFFLLALSVFFIWAVLIGAVGYALYRVYLYFAARKGLSHGQAGRSGRVQFKVYANYKGSGQSGGRTDRRDRGAGEIIDMPVEEVRDGRNSLPKE